MPPIKKKGKATVSKKRNRKNIVSKNILIGELLDKHPEVVPVLISHGFHCIGCAVSPFESLEAGAAVHGIPIDPLMKDLNTAVASTKRKQ